MKKWGRIISRILFPPRRMLVIHLGLSSQTSSCNLPALMREPRRAAWSCSRVGFTWLPLLPTVPVVSYTTLSPVSTRRWMSTLCCTCRPLRDPPFRRHSVLRSSDFPPSTNVESDQLTNLNINYSSAPSQNKKILHEGHEIILLLSFTSITICGGNFV